MAKCEALDRHKDSLAIRVKVSQVTWRRLFTCKRTPYSHLRKQGAAHTCFSKGLSCSFKGLSCSFKGLSCSFKGLSRFSKGLCQRPSGGGHVAIGRWSLATSERKTGISPLGMICCVPVWSIYSVKKAEAFAPSRNPMSRKLLEGIEIANFYYLWK